MLHKNICAQLTVVLVACLGVGCTNTKKLGAYWINGQALYELPSKGKECAPDSSSMHGERAMVQIEAVKEDSDTLGYLKVIEVYRAVTSKARLISAEIQGLAPRTAVRGSVRLECPIQAPKDTAFFPPRMKEHEHPVKCLKRRWANGGYVFPSERFWYRETSPILQAITVPAKLRFSVDTLNATGETDLTFGIGVGWRNTWHSYRNHYSCSNRTYISSSQRQITLAWGLFIAPVGQDLEADNTRNNYQGERTALGISYGAFTAAEINKITIGIALGMDHPLGVGARDWIYRDVPWLGIIVGLSMFDVKE